MLPLSSIRALGLSFAFGCAVLVPAGAHAVVVDLVVQKDNTIYSESDASSNGAGDYFFAGLNGDGRQRRGLIDVAGALPAGSTINSVTLAATHLCLADNLSSTSVSISGPAFPGQSLWYLVRAVNAGGNGTYDTGLASQSGKRDAEILASGADCP